MFIFRYSMLIFKVNFGVFICYTIYWFNMKFDFKFRNSGTKDGSAGKELVEQAWKPEFDP